MFIKCCFGELASQKDDIYLVIINIIQILCLLSDDPAIFRADKTLAMWS